jgi:tripeptidyl-peptidase-1
LTKDEADKLVAPHPDSVNLVMSWLSYHGIDPITQIHHSSAGGGDFIFFSVPVPDAERLLNTKYNIYYHQESNSYAVRTLGYSLPRILHDHVALVTPTTYFGNVRSMKSTYLLEPIIPDVDGGTVSLHNTNLETPSSCQIVITPDCLRALYNTTSYVVKANGTNKLGVVGYLGEFANQADLQVLALDSQLLICRLTLH